MKNASKREVPATFVAVSQPIEDRVNQLLSGSRADLAIKIFGHDLETMQEIGDRIAAILRTVPGTGDLRVQRVAGSAAPRRAASIGGAPARYGHSSRRGARDASRRRAPGFMAGKVFEGPRRFEVKLLQPPPTPEPESTR